MVNLTRLMILVAVAFVAARPAMACCLTGHGEPAAVETVGDADGQPCHDMAPGAASALSEAPDETLDRFDCPDGCASCDRAVAQAQSASDAVLPPANGPEATTILTAQFAGFEPSAFVLKTGPPGAAPPELRTPIALKQRLLV